MKSSRRRKLAALLALSWVVAHPATRAPLLLLALSLGHHAGGHSYSLSLGEDAGHFDLVLSHADTADHEHGDSQGCSESDHVLHLCGDLALREAGRRHDPAAGLALILTTPIVYSRSQPLAPGVRSEARTHGSDPLGTVVLRC